MRFKIATLFLILLSIAEANNLVEILLPNNQWKLIGVPGGFREGSETDKFSQSTDWHGYNDFNDSLNDNLYTGIQDDGDIFSGITNGKLSDNNLIVAYNVLNNNGASEPTSVYMNVNTSGHNYDSQSPTNGMYISADGSGNADIHIKYQAHLENNTFEMKIAFNSIEHYYSGIFNSSNSESNPQILTEKTGNDVNITEELEITNIIDMNFTDNPGRNGNDNSLESYVSSDRTQMDSNDYLRVWRRDSVNNIWESYHSKNSYNNFTKLVPGSAYWVKLHDDNETTTQHGFILGNGSISESTFSSNYTPLSSELNTSLNTTAHRLIAEGWNMLSFNNGDIRDSSTGLIITLKDNINESNSFTIKDNSGAESVNITLFDIDGNSSISVQEVARAVNIQIGLAKATNQVSRNFNIRALPSNDKLILISNKRFRVYESGDDIFGEVTTIGGQYPLNLQTNGYSACSDLDTNGIASRYGEFSLIVTINNNGAGEINGPLSAGFTEVGKIQINNNSAISLTGETNISDLTDNIEGDSDINKVTAIDLDLNGYLDSVIMVNNSSPFYIRDHTFSRTYLTDITNALNKRVFIDNGIGSITNVTLDNNDTVSDIATSLDGKVTNIEANCSSDNNSNYIYLVTDEISLRYFDLKDTGTSTDIFKAVYSDNAKAQGAITKVYSLSDLSKAEITKSIYIVDINQTEDSNDTNISVQINDVNTLDAKDSSNHTYSLITDIISNINDLNQSILAESNITDTNSEDNKSAKLTITGYFTKASIDSNNSALGGDNNSDFNGTQDWNQTTIGGDIITNTNPIIRDLKYLPIWTPNFPTEKGAVHYLKSGGFDTVFMLSSVEDGTGSIVWNFLDLTKDTDKWFNLIDDYSLFTTEMERGYWVYLKSGSSSSLEISNPTITTNFIHHYNNDNDTREVDNFLMNGSISTQVTGFEGSDNSVIATTTNGLKFNFSQSGSYYSLDLSSYELGYLPASEQTITIKAFDSKGNYKEENITLDLEPPTQPLVQFIDGKHLFIGVPSTESTLTANIYSGPIDEQDATPNNKDGNTYVVKVDSNSLTINAENLGGSTTKTIDGHSVTLPTSPSTVAINGTTYTFKVYNICQDTNSFNSANSGWRVVAVDGENADTSRVSNISYISDNEENASTFYTFYKNASILYSPDKDTVDSNPTTYDSNCMHLASDTGNNGVTLQTISDDNTTRIAYEGISGVSIGTGIPKIGYIKLKNNDQIIKIQFVSNYVTKFNSSLSSPKNIYIYNGTIGTVYKTTFDELYGTEEDHDSDSKALELDTDDNIALTGQYIDYNSSGSGNYLP